MIFDTDIIIWSQRGNRKAAALIDSTEKRFLSLQSNLELLQDAQNKSQQEAIRDFIVEFDFRILPFTENIGHRALIYVEEYSLSAGIGAGDAIIAATAIENDLPLMTSNAKHFKAIRELKLKVFKP